jgi:hypothetical protein
MIVDMDMLKLDAISNAEIRSRPEMPGPNGFVLPLAVPSLLQPVTNMHIP